MLVGEGRQFNCNATVDGKMTKSASLPGEVLVAERKGARMTNDDSEGVF